MSKGYTINYFIGTFSSASAKKLATTNIYDVVAPRGGYESVKAEALDFWLDDKTDAIVNGSGSFATYGKTVRARVLKALRTRKATGNVV